MNKSKIRIFHILCLILLLTIFVGISSCENPDEVVDEPNNNDPVIDEPETEVEEDPANVEVTMTTSFADTAYKFDVYYYTTDKEGPKILIMGGTHGDERAGWTAGTELIEKLKTEKGICGSIMLIPKVNTLACQAVSRYKVTGYNFSDLNRSFPLGREDDATSLTISISTEVVRLIEDFDPDYIIDLHESRNSWEKMESGKKTTLGDTLIASNKSVIVRQIIRNYNDNYRLESETEFRQEGSNQEGTFNYYFTNTYPDKVVITIETNRDYRNLQDNIDLSVRVRQQLNMLEALFDYAWGRTN